MKTLLVLRHAKSSWKFTNLSDFQRPLNKRGKRDAPRMGALIKSEDLVPDLIISSSAARALATAEAVAEASGYENDIEATDNLYHAGVAAYLEVLGSLPDKVERVLVVGHNPGIEDFVDDISGEWVRMPTAALVHIELPLDSWSDLDQDFQGTIKNDWLPKELP